MSRGIRQGCPLSCLLFILVVEILGNQIRDNKVIKGFSFGSKEHKNSQYADDTVLMVSDIDSIHEALNTVNEFSAVAGPKLNKDKVEGIWLGPFKEYMSNTYAGIKWTNDAVRCLGIYIGHDREKCRQMNWTNKLVKIKKLLRQWDRRNLTILGKVMIVKALALPLITYGANILRPPDILVKELDRELKRFIGVKRHRLNAKCIIRQVEDGGIAFPDVECTFKALKARWIGRLLSKTCICTNTANYWYGKLGFDLESITKCTFKSLNVFPILKKIPEFYQDILIAYNNCKTVKSVFSCSKHEIVSDIIWGNERYMYNGKCLYLGNWIKSDIMYIKDILKTNGHIFDVSDLLKVLEIKVNWIAEYQKVKKACKIVEVKDLKDMYAFVNIKNENMLFVIDKHYDVRDKRCNFYYNILRNHKMIHPYMQQVWCKQLEMTSLRFHTTWQKIYICKLKLKR